MKKMTYEEFAQRTAEITKAKKIFMPHITNNITTAFEIYQELLAEEEMQVMISTLLGGNKEPSILDMYERPKCPECGVDLRLRIGTADAEGKEWPTAWVCSTCLAEYYSEKTPQQWVEELHVREE